MRFLVMVAVAAGICYGILEYKKKLESLYHGLTSDEALVAGASGDNPYRGSAAKLLRAARPELANAIFSSLAISQECKPYVDQIQKLDLIELERNHYELSYQQLPIVPEACRFEDQNTKAALDALAAVCKPAVNQSEKLDDKCANQLFMLRAALTKQMYQAKPLSSITDLRVLTDLMFAEFAKINNTTMPDLRRAKDVADRMLELNPSMYVAAKVGAFAEVVEAMSMKQRNPSMIAEEWSAAAHAVERAKHLNPNDETIADAEMLIKTQGFEPARALAYSNEMIQKNGSDAKAWYLKAYAEWKGNARPAAVESLKRATALAPANREYAQALAEVSKPNPKPDAFSASLTFGVFAEDFNQ